MGEIKTAAPVLPFVGIMYTSDETYQQVLPQLQERLGENFEESKALCFSDLTPYYNKEMGNNIFKKYLFFTTPIDRVELPQLKHFSDSIEQQYKNENNQRTVNIDPGYLSKDKFVLASTKDFFHRLYIADNIYAEVTLHFRGGKYRYFSWTYEDYKTPMVLDLLTRTRKILFNQ